MIAKIISAVLASMRLVPYKQRVALGGAFFQYVVSPVSKNKERILENVDHVVPELDTVARARLIAGVPNNMGRTLTELFFPDGFLKVIDNCPLTGDGYQAFKTAREHGQPVILVAGHIGNYDAIRGKLVREGHPIGSLYKPMKNPYFDREYVETISRIGFPLFPNDANGMGKLKVIDTPMGNIARALLKAGAKLGVSSRGSGNVNESGRVSDFDIVTVDIVAQPSAPDAYPKTIYESLFNMKGGSMIHDIAKDYTHDKTIGAKKHLDKSIIDFINELKLR